MKGKVSSTKSGEKYGNNQVVLDEIIKLFENAQKGRKINKWLQFHSFSIYKKRFINKTHICQYIFVNLNQILEHKFLISCKSSHVQNANQTFFWDWPNKNFELNEDSPKLNSIQNILCHNSQLVTISLLKQKREMKLKISFQIKICKCFIYARNKEFVNQLAFTTRF